MLVHTLQTYHSRESSILSVYMSLSLSPAEDCSIGTCFYTWPRPLMPCTLSAPYGDKSILDELAELNRVYRNKHGFVFLVCATGKPAHEVLGLLKARLPNDRETEVSDRARSTHPQAP